MTRTDFGYFLHEESIHIDHELRWNLLVLELLKYDTDNHEILDVVWSNDEAGRWHFLHRSGGDGRSGSRIEK